MYQTATLRPRRSAHLKTKHADAAVDVGVYVKQPTERQFRIVWSTQETNDAQQTPAADARKPARLRCGVGPKKMPRFQHPIEHPLAAEAAAALGYAGEKLRKTLDALKEYDSAVASLARLPEASLRAELVAEAAEAFWGYVVQREEFGLLDAEYIREQYSIPDEVWRAMGPKIRS
jgi:hypothetical protein